MNNPIVFLSLVQRYGGFGLTSKLSFHFSLQLYGQQKREWTEREKRPNFCPYHRSFYAEKCLFFLSVFTP